MTTENGFVKIYRKMLTWEWMSSAKTAQLFLILLLLANHKDQSWQGMVIRGGQTVTSIDSLTKFTGQTAQSIRTGLKRLKSTSEITIKSTNKYTLITIEKWALYQSDDAKVTSKSTNRYTVLTVVNYGKYQQIEKTATSKSTNEQQTNNKQTTNKQQHRNNVNNVNNVNNTRDRAQKIAYADNVSMTEDEHGKLIKQYGEGDTARLIEILNNYKAASGKKYASDYAAILNWVVKRLAEDKAKGITKEKPSYDLEAFKKRSAEPLVYKKKGATDGA